MFSSGTSNSSKLMVTGALVVLLAGAAVTAQANETVALKHALYGAGYEVNNVNASMDAATRASLEAFQSDHPDLTVTGEIDEATKQALGILSVEVAAVSQGSSQTVSAGTSAAPEPQTEEAQAEEAVKEDDDGGWSFFN